MQQIKKATMQMHARFAQGGVHHLVCLGFPSPGAAGAGWGWEEGRWVRGQCTQQVFHHHNPTFMYFASFTSLIWRVIIGWNVKFQNIAIFLTFNYSGEVH